MFTSVVMTMQDALGLMVTSPVMSPTSLNCSYISRYFWLLSACRRQGGNRLDRFDKQGRDRFDKFDKFASTSLRVGHLLADRLALPA